MKTSEKKTKSEIIKKIDFSGVKNLTLKQRRSLKKDVKAVGQRVMAEMSRRDVGH